MATKKSSAPALEETVKEEQELTDAELDQMVKDYEKDHEEMEKLRAELAKMRHENELLRKNSIGGGGDAGGRTDYERVQEACEKAAAEGKDAWDIKISVRAPRRPAKEDPFYWFNINGRTIQIPATDRYYELALPFASALVDMIRAEWFASDYIDSIEEYDPVTNPHRD